MKKNTLKCSYKIVKGYDRMNINEYQKVKNFTYLEYCDYLQEKYGIGIADYMTKSYNPNLKTAWLHIIKKKMP